MQRRFRKGDSDLEPDLFLYSSLCNAWAGTGRDDAEDRILSIIEEMDAANVPPDTRTYNSLLEFLSRRNVADKSDRAERVVAMMRARKIQPNRYTNMFLHRISNSQVPPKGLERQQDKNTERARSP